MTNEEYIISKISERSLADMFNTGNCHYNNLNDRIYKAFWYWKESYRHKRSDRLLFQLWLTFQYNSGEWDLARQIIQEEHPSWVVKCET